LCIASIFFYANLKIIIIAQIPRDLQAVSGDFGCSRLRGVCTDVYIDIAIPDPGKLFLFAWRGVVKTKKKKKQIEDGDSTTRKA